MFVDWSVSGATKVHFYLKCDIVLKRRIPNMFMFVRTHLFCQKGTNNDYRLKYTTNTSLNTTSQCLPVIFDVFQPPSRTHQQVDSWQRNPASAAKLGYTHLLLTRPLHVPVFLKSLFLLRNGIPVKTDTHRRADFTFSRRLLRLTKPGNGIFFASALLAYLNSPDWDGETAKR